MIKETGRSIHLEVDGGIDPTTVSTVVEAGANVLVAGTAIFHSTDMAEAIRTLRQGGKTS